MDNQKKFEKNVAYNFGFLKLMQRDTSEVTILDEFNSSEFNFLSGTIGYNKKTKDITEMILIATKDSETNYISEISFDMIKDLIKAYCTPLNNKVIFATNIPIEIHSEKVKDFKKIFNFHIETIGYSYCIKHNLEFIEMY